MSEKLDILVEDETDCEESQAPMPAGKRSRLISRVLAPAVSWWLRSQLEQVEDLSVSIDAGDRQLLSGSITQVLASASRAIYQGLHFSQVEVTGRNIHTNLRQVLRGKPFRLLAAFPVQGEISLSEADLNASLTAPLLANAITDFLVMLLQPASATAIANPTAAYLTNAKARLQSEKISLSASLVSDQLEIPIALSACLSIKNGNILKLQAIEVIRYEAGTAHAIAVPSSLVFPLGSDVRLDEFVIQPEKLLCRGEIMVIPPESPSEP